jgi:hypothetical protein
LNGAIKDLLGTLREEVVMFNDHLYFKIHQSRHAELIRQGEAQRLAESLVPKRHYPWQIALATAEEQLEMWWEGIKCQVRDVFVREHPSISDPC